METTETEVWFRNPHNYARELVEANYGLVAWDRGIVHKRNLDTVAHASLFFGETIPFRILLIGEQGTAEVGVGRNVDKPIAVYPTWAYGEEQALLEEMIQNPIGENAEVCADKSIQPDQRPVFGQEHRVVVTNIPVATSLGGRGFYRMLKQLQEDYPKCIIHLHGSYSYQMMFGIGLKSIDCDPRTPAQKGKLCLPIGRELAFDSAKLTDLNQYFAMMDFLPVDMKIPRNRCVFNIRSFVWCGKNYRKDKLPSLRRSRREVDVTSSDGEFIPRSTRNRMKERSKPGDMIACDSCTLADSCAAMRAGAICTVKGNDVSELSKFFRTRDAGQIIDGLSELLSRNADRLDRGMESEDDLNELDPEVTKIIGQMFDQGTKLAKLVDPSLRGAAVAVNVLQTGGGQSAVSYTNPKEMLAAALRELERNGIARKDVTSEMLEGMLSGMASQANASKAIEGTVLSQDLQ